MLPDMVPVCPWTWGTVPRQVVKGREIEVQSILNPERGTGE